MAYKPPSHDPRQVRMSVRAVGVALKGMDQKVAYSGPAMSLLISAHKNSGVLQLSTTGTSILGKLFDTKDAQEWGDRLDLVASKLNAKEPVYFAIFRDPLDVLFITYIPDNAKPKVKTVYATNKESVKEGITSLSDELVLEEINVTNPEELSYEKYKGKHEAPKPYSEAELLRKEQEESETAGGYGVLARIMNAQKGVHTNRDVLAGNADAKPFQLPGLGQIGQVKLKPAGKIKIPAKNEKTNSIQNNLKPIGKTKISKTSAKDSSNSKLSIPRKVRTERQMQGAESEDFPEPEIIIKKGLNERASRSASGQFEEKAVKREKLNPYKKKSENSLNRSFKKDVPSPYKKKASDVSLNRSFKKEIPSPYNKPEQSKEIPTKVQPVDEDLLLAPTEKATPYEQRKQETIPDPVAHESVQKNPEPTPVEEEEESEEGEDEESVGDEQPRPAPKVSDLEQEYVPPAAATPLLSPEPQPKKKGGFFGFISKLFGGKKKGAGNDDLRL